MNSKIVFSTIVAVGLLGGCTTMPERIEVLEDARAAVNRIDQDPMAQRVGGNGLEQARTALRRAEVAYEERDDVEVVRHNAYLALRHAEIVDQRIQEARIRERIESSEAERNQVLLQARERDVRIARSGQEQQAMEAARARAIAEVSAAQARRSEQEAAEAQAYAAGAIAEAQAMQQELADLKAEQTERGLVLTLGDVLFDTDQSDLKPGAENTLNRLAAFLRDHSERQLLIEGHTDSRGDDSYNRALSDRRANAVRRALIERGIDRSRLEAEGMGEHYPVATNDTVAGRQQNRRVEIVLSDHEGSFPESAQRGVAATD